MAENQHDDVRGAIAFQHPIAFWSGLTACTVGVLLHLPMYYGTRSMHYRMAGMRPDAPMLIGMALIVVGLVLTTYGLVPRASGRILEQTRRIKVAALDDAPLNARHVGLLLVLAVAVTLDVMKPITLSFVAPGMGREYMLKSPANPHGHIPVALLPLSGIGGTVIGSFGWGWIGDRIGRRASILLAGVLFVTTAICGAMPGFTWNLLMCFLMGLGVGGLLPIAFVLMAETIPARHRGWVMVLIGGDVAGAYVITSWLSAKLTPEYSWRILWLIGIPTGLLLLLLNRFIPESPRYLLATGRPAAAEAVMARYGAAVEPESGLIPAPAPTWTQDPDPDPKSEKSVSGSYRNLFKGAFLGPTAAITIFGLGIGLIAFGFQQWIPVNLQKLGYSDVTSAYILRDSSLIGFPLNFVVAALYGFWSSKRTILLLSGLTAAALFGFAFAGDLAHNRGLVSVLLIVPIWGISSLVAVIGAYSCEIYPTRIRARGAGHAAAVSKIGGVAILAVVAAASIPSIGVTALIGAVPLTLAVIVFAFVGRETRGRKLEEITANPVVVPV